MGLQFSLQPGSRCLLLGGLRQYLLQTLAQIPRLPGNALLLLALLDKVGLQLLDLQLQGFATAVDAGLAGIDLATDGLQASRSFFADPGKTLLGRYQLLLHQRHLLEAPPAKPGQGNEGRP
ncbi:hypothetical protein D3C84_711470 [compost metagenome]